MSKTSVQSVYNIMSAKQMQTSKKKFHRSLKSLMLCYAMLGYNNAMQGLYIEIISILYLQMLKNIIQ